MDKKLFVHLQGGRKVSGTLRGYDLFLNLVIDDALEETNPAQKHPIGTVVSVCNIPCVIGDAHAYSSAGYSRQQRNFHGDTRSNPVTRPFVCRGSAVFCIISVLLPLCSTSAEYQTPEVNWMHTFALQQLRVICYAGTCEFHAFTAVLAHTI